MSRLPGGLPFSCISCGERDLSFESGERDLQSVKRDLDYCLARDLESGKRDLQSGERDLQSVKRDLDYCSPALAAERERELSEREESLY